MNVTHHYMTSLLHKFMCTIVHHTNCALNHGLSHFQLKWFGSFLKTLVQDFLSGIVIVQFLKSS